MKFCNMLKINRIVVSALVSVLLVLGLAVPPAHAGAVRDLMKAKEKVVRKVLSTPTSKDSPAHITKENELRTTINQLFDFEELGMRALELHWDGLDEVQRKDFIATLQSLIEKNYLLKVTSSTSYKIQWGPETTEEDHTLIIFRISSGKYKATIQFKVLQKNGAPVVFDMLIDEVSLLENYRSQFNRIIRKKGFDQLMEKMKRRLTEMEDSGDLEDDKTEKLEKSEKVEPATPVPPAGK